MLKSKYIQLLKQYEVLSSTAIVLWSEIETNHSKSSRHYHNLTHLEDLFFQLSEVKPQIHNWNITLFTLFYHDVIYNATKKDNEQKSAELAQKRLKEIGVNENEIEMCFDQILATKAHMPSQNSDTNYFTDADLSILGRDPATYVQYCENIRKEYSIYPTFMYNRGRKKVINHFLGMDRIFKTEYFFKKFERQAKVNLNDELNSLT